MNAEDRSSRKAKVGYDCPPTLCTVSYTAKQVPTHRTFVFRSATSHGSSQAGLMFSRSSPTGSHNRTRMLHIPFNKEVLASEIIERTSAQALYCTFHSPDLPHILLRGSLESHLFLDSPRAHQDPDNCCHCK